MGLEAYSTTAASNNSSPPNGAPEGMAPSGVNDCIRQIMADVRSYAEGAEWFNFGHTPTRVDNDTFTVVTDLTAIYQVGRRLKVTGSATGYCTITASSYGAPNTTIDVTMDSGNLPGTLSAVYVALLSVTNASFPKGLTLTGTAFIPTGSTIPANGLYLSAANTPALASNSTLRWSVNSTGNHTIVAPSTGVPVVINQLSANGGEVLRLDSTGTSPFLSFYRSGVRKSYINNDASAGFLWVQEENLPSIIYTNNTQRLVIAGAGNVTINAPSSGNALTITSASATDVLRLSASSGAAGGLAAGWSAGLASNAWNLYTQSTDPFAFGTGGAASSSWYTNSVARVVVGSAGNVTIAAPSSGTALAISAAAAARALSLTGGANEYTQTLTASATSGQSFGMQVLAGTTSADIPLIVQNQSGGTTFFRINGDGSILTGAPTGGGKGAGTLNTAGAIYQNGTLVIESGTFTGTLTGCTTAPTFTCVWSRSGNMVTLHVPNTAFATSNSVSCGFTGLPASIQAARAQTIPLFDFIDNGVAVSDVGIAISGSGTVVFNRVNGAAFTTSGTKGVSTQFAVTYLLN